MPTPLRIASFNVENLLSRAKLLNFEDNSAADPYLVVVQDLRDELAKETYDKPRILQLYHEVEDYIYIVEVREKLFNKTKTKVVVNGVREWSGFIAFKREGFSQEARINTAKVIKQVNADIFCLIEVESRPVLKHFCGDRLQSGGNFKRYPHLMLIDGNDNREIDVALMSRLPIGAMWSHVDDRNGTQLVFSRDCLELRLAHPAGFEVALLINHFKSKGYGSQPTSNAKRKLQAERVAEILKGYDLTKDLVVVAGDLNDTPDSAPLTPLLAVPDLYDVLALHFPNAADRWTYHYKQNQQIDYVLVSRPLRDALQQAGVERQGMYKVETYTGGATQPFNTVQGYRSSASDHGAVWADFAIP